MIPLAPMLLTSARQWPAGGDWALEPKWDGYRFVAHIADGQARCWTRHGTDLTSRIGSLWSTVFGGGDDQLSLVVFDSPVLAGESLAARPWYERRSALEAALPAAGRAVSLIDVFAADLAVHERLLALGFEGSVLKRRDGRYLPGERSRSWRKHKTRATSTAVVEVAIADRASGIVERIGCRAVDDPDRLTWATVWHPAYRRRLTRDPVSAIGRDAIVTYTHRTVSGALREARLTDLR